MSMYYLILQFDTFNPCTTTAAASTPDEVSARCNHQMKNHSRTMEEEAATLSLFPAPIIIHCAKSRVSEYCILERSFAFGLQYMI
jgi:hypothetical protein